MKIKNVSVYGLEQSIIRSGYPMQTGEPEDLETTFSFGRKELSDHLYGEGDVPKDMARAKKLAKTPVGSGHNNFLKGIIVQFDLQYPEYFSLQLQRYNWIDIVSSQSKMHKITSRKLTEEDFTKNTNIVFISTMNVMIRNYNNADDKLIKEELFKDIISSLPSGYLKWMGISTNYLQLNFRRA